MDYSQDIIIRVLLEDIKFFFFNIAIIVDFLVNATPLGHVWSWLNVNYEINRFLIFNQSINQEN